MGQSSACDFLYEENGTRGMLGSRMTATGSRDLQDCPQLPVIAHLYHPIQIGLPQQSQLPPGIHRQVPEVPLTSRRFGLGPSLSPSAVRGRVLQHRQT